MRQPCLLLKRAVSPSNWEFMIACGRYLVREGRALGVEVIDRCNLTVLQEPGQEDLVDFLASNQACPLSVLVSSCYCVSYPGSLISVSHGVAAFFASFQ
jgi:hypothetical protein